MTFPRTIVNTRARLREKACEEASRAAAEAHPAFFDVVAGDGGLASVRAPSMVLPRGPEAALVAAPLKARPSAGALRHWVGGRRTCRRALADAGWAGEN